MRHFFYFFIFSFCTAIHAQTHLTRQVPKFIINAGTYTGFYKQLQINESGDLNTFSTNPTIGAGLFIPLKYRFTFVPEINWVLPQKSGERIIKNIWMIRGDFSYKLISWFNFRIGSSLIWLNQQGGGGSVKMRNGNSTTTFYYPDENRSSLNNTFDLGAEFIFLKNWGLRLQTYTFSLLKSERRQTSYSLFLSYYWDRGAP